MARRNYLISLIIDVFAYLILVVCTINLSISVLALILGKIDINITDSSHWLITFFPVYELFVWFGFLYFYFIFVPYKNKQGTMGDVVVNIRLKKNTWETEEEKYNLTHWFLIKRLIFAFIFNSFLFFSFIYMFFKKSNKQTFHDKLSKSRYEHVKVIKDKK